MRRNSESLNPQQRAELSRAKRELQLMEGKVKRGETVEDAKMASVKANVAYLMDKQREIAQKTEKTLAVNQQRREDLSEEQSFRQFKERQTQKKLEDAMSAKLNHNPIAADSNHASIMALIEGEGEMESINAKRQTAIELQEELQGQQEQQSPTNAPPTRGRRRSVMTQETIEVADAFAVDEDLQLEKRGGRPVELPDPDDFNSIVDSALENSERQQSVTENGEEGERDMGSMSLVGGFSLSSPIGAAAKRRSRLRAAASMIKTLNPTTKIFHKTNAHDLAQLFNTLKSNDIIRVVTEVPPADPKSAYNRVEVLSPTNGFRMHHHLLTTDGNPVVHYTSQEWCAQQSMMQLILSNEVDNNFIGHVAGVLQSTHKELCLAREVSHQKDKELVRLMNKTSALERGLEEVAGRNRQRKQQAMQLAVAIEEVLETMEAVGQAPHLRKLLGLRDHGADIGRPTNLQVLFDDGGDAVMLTELKEVMLRMGEARQIIRGTPQATGIEDSSPSAETGDLMPLDMTASSIGIGMLGGTTPGLHDLMAGTSRTMGESSPLGTAINRSAAHTTMIRDADAHDTLLLKLQHRLQRRDIMDRVERSMQAAECMAMEAEDTLAAASTTFRLGGPVTTTIRDAINILTPAQKEQLFGTSSVETLCAAHSTTVVCPFCKFDFDPSLPLSEFKSRIDARRNAAAQNHIDMLTKQSEKTPLKGKGKRGKRDAPTSDELRDFFGSDLGIGAIALQEMITELQKELAEAQTRIQELEGERDQQTEAIKAMEELLEKLRNDWKEQRRDLLARNEQLLDELDAKSSEIDTLNREKTVLQQQVVAVQKAAQDAFEELELIRRLEKEVMVRGAPSLSDRSSEEFEKMAVVYHRKFYQAEAQLARHGHKFVEMVDKECGSNQEIPDLAEITTQVTARDFIKMLDRGVETVTKHVDSSTEMKPWPTFSEVTTQATYALGLTIDPRSVIRDLEEATSAMLKDYLYGAVRNECSDGGDALDKLRNLIETKEEEERAEQERKSNLEAVVMERRRLQKQFDEKENQLRLTIDELKKESFAADQRAQSSQTAINRLVTTPGFFNPDGTLNEETLRNDKELFEIVERARTASRQASPAMSVGVGGSLTPRFGGVGGGVSRGCSAGGISLSEHVASLATRSVQAGVLVPPDTVSGAVTMEEDLNRALIEAEYEGFCIPMPLLKEVLQYAAKGILRMRRVPEWNPAGSPRTTMAMNKELVGEEELGVKAEMPSGWYHDPKHDTFVRYMVDRDGGGPMEWKPLEVREFPPIVPTERNKDGSYKKEYIYRQGHAVPRDDIPSSLAGSPAGSPTAGSPHMRRQKMTPWAQPETTGSLVINSIAARLTMNRVERRLAELDDERPTQEPADEPTEGKDSTQQVKKMARWEAEEALLEVMRDQLKTQVKKFAERRQQHRDRYKRKDKVASSPAVEDDSSQGAEKHEEASAAKDPPPRPAGVVVEPTVFMGAQPLRVAESTKQKSLHPIATKGFTGNDVKKYAIGRSKPQPKSNGRDLDPISMGPGALSAKLQQLPISDSPTLVHSSTPPVQKAATAGSVPRQLAPLSVVRHKSHSTEPPSQLAESRSGVVMAKSYDSIDRGDQTADERAAFRNRLANRLQNPPQKKKKSTRQQPIEIDSD